MFLILAIGVFLAFPSPWNVILGLVCLVPGIAEVAFWHGRVRNKKAKTGVETLVGATGEAAERLAPAGHVRIRGELWQARASSAIPAGSSVRVVAVQGLTLEVEAIDAAI